MPSERPSAHHPGSTRQGPPEKLQHPPSSGGVRMLLGLPFRDSSTPATAALTAPPGRHRYGQSPLPAPEESHESFEETAPDEGVIEEARTAGADVPAPLARRLIYETNTPRDFPCALRHDGAPLSPAMRENTAEARSTPTQPSAEHHAQTHLVIPGVSTHRTAFPTLSRTTDTTISVAGEPPHAIPPPAAPLNAPVSLPRAHEMTTSDVELLTRLEQLVTAGVKAQKGSGAQNGERDGQDLARRFEQLQRTVRDLAATVSSQAAGHRDRQAQRHERQTPPLQRTVIMKRSDASSTAPRAFWERSRLGRLYLKTGR